jgi:hypothetical protein
MVWLVNATPRRLHPRERPDTCRTGDWVGARAGLDGRGKCPHQDSIPGPPSLYTNFTILPHGW